MIDFTELLWESREVLHVKAPSQNVMFIIAWVGLELFQEPVIEENTLKHHTLLKIT